MVLGLARQGFLLGLFVGGIEEAGGIVAGVGVFGAAAFAGVGAVADGEGGSG